MYATIYSLVFYLHPQIVSICTIDGAKAHGTQYTGLGVMATTVFLFTPQKVVHGLHLRGAKGKWNTLHPFGCKCYTIVLTV